MSEWTKHYIGREVTASEDNGVMRPISRVTLYVDQDNVFTAGDDTGYEIIADCPHATQAMVDALLASLKGYQYKMVSGDAADIDPAAELGDGMTVDGMYSVLAHVNDRGSRYMDVSAPGEAELEDEFPMDGPLTRQIVRNIAAAKSSIEKTINSITLDVTGALGGQAKIELKVNEQVKTSGSVDLSKVRQSFAEDQSSITISAGVITFNGNTFVVNSDNFKVSTDGTVTATNANISGTVNAKAGVFESVTIKDSSLGGTLNADGTFTGTHSGGTLSRTGGSFTGTNSGTLTGTHSGGSVSGCTLSNSTGGTYVGTVSGGRLSSCNLNGTTLRTDVNSSNYFSASSAGATLLYGPSLVMQASTAQMLVVRSNGVSIAGDLSVGQITSTGNKSRAIGTKDFDVRCLDALETPLPTFSDYGMAALDGAGVCCIVIDPVFAETVNSAYLPTVFLTKYGEGDIWVENVEHDTVAVRGTPGLRFAWETRYAQANTVVDRLRVMGYDFKDESREHDFDGEANVDYEHSETNVDYALAGYEYFTEFERSIEAA